MKQILKYLKKYLAEHFNVWLYLGIAVFLGASIYWNYHTGFYRVYLTGPFARTGISFFYHCLFYAFPWLVGMGLQALLTRRAAFLQEPGFWGMFLVAVAAVALTDWFPHHRLLAEVIFPPEAYYFGVKTLWNLKTSFFYLIPVLLYWFIWDRKKHQSNLYGLTYKGFDARPYLFMLAIVVPGIIWASFQPDFLQTYPTFLPGPESEYWKIPKWVPVAIYEFLYGADFTFVELYFRGFLVIGMARWMGKDAIIPMICMYCFLHFGKPAGETISSAFGGYILGVIAYYSRTILGGVFIHIGVALLMELAAWGQIL
ncbi:MAG: CPBP family intramembrane metalloprotease [Bacteroidia bacterium]|nr:CPBP family intramembrane metalloprotease [Bacteroidia bacterium]